MRERNRPLFTLVATVLALWLVLGFLPISALNKLLLSVGILLTGGAALWYLRRYSLRRQASCAQVAAALLPPENFRGALVLVGGDTGALFPAGGDYRESRQGWYLRAANAEQLPLLAQHIALTRPALVHDIKEPSKEKHNHLERIELRYEKITWTYKDGNIIHSDSWNERTTA